MKKFKGIIPALITPLNADETINVEVLRKLTKNLLSRGADGFYIGGATGEGIALRPEERMILAEEGVKCCEGKSSIVHIASVNFSEAVMLAKHAESVGADAISAIPPLFFKYDEDDVYNYYKRLAEAVHIPLMIYYNPRAGVNINAEFAARMFEIDNITAIKWTSSDYYGMMRLKDLTNGEMNIINGPDEMFLMGLSAGAEGGIGTTYNVILEDIRAIYDNFVKGDIEAARKAQYKANKYIAEIIKSPQGISATKVSLEEMGFDVGNTVFPMKRFTQAQRDDFINKTKDLVPVL